MVRAESEMTAAQKTMMSEFNKSFFEFTFKYWNPSVSEDYWDSLADDAVNLIESFQTNDSILNNFIQTIVAAFMNSREEIIANQ